MHALTWPYSWPCIPPIPLQLLHYCFAIVGVVWFAGKLPKLESSSVDVHFDSFGEALRTLFQVRRSHRSYPYTTTTVLSPDTSCVHGVAS